MRILYGVQATGNGHMARARALTPELRKAGIQVDFVFSGRPREQLFTMDIFGDDYHCFRGLTFVTEKGRLKPLKTLLHNPVGRFLQDVRQLDVAAYDLVLSDFEPVTAWAAKLRGKPSMSISHQSAFDYAVPRVNGHYLSRTLMTLFAPTKHRIGLHWHHFNQPILPPLIEPQQPKAAIRHKILVYMGFEQLDDILALLTPFSHCQFVVYSAVAQPRQQGHIRIEPLSHQRFHQDLLDCEGVISNAGFELASECLMLGKKLLVKPLHGQYEQLCNAEALQQLQRGQVMMSLDHNAVEHWLQQTAPAAISYPDVAAALAQWIKAGDYQNTGALQYLWQGVDQDFSAVGV